MKILDSNTSNKLKKIITAASRCMRIFMVGALLGTILVPVFAPSIAAQSEVVDSDSIYGDHTFYQDNSPCANVAQSATGAISASGKVYMIGDSITNGSKTQLETSLKGKGYSQVIIDALDGRTLSAGITTLESSKDQYKDAGAVIIALGTNGGFAAESIKQTIDTIKAAPSSAKIYWVNIGVDNSKRDDPDIDGDGLNKILQDNTSQGYTVIDWASQVKAHPEYIDPNPTTGLGVHTTGSGIQAFADTVASAIAGGSTNSGSTSSACACSVSGASLVGSDNAQKIWNYFIGKGYKPFQVAGMMGNMQNESHFEPRLVQYGMLNSRGEVSVAGQPSSLDDVPPEGAKTGYGIVQWTPATKILPSFERYNSSHDPDVLASDLGFQVELLWSQLEGSGIAEGIFTKYAGDSLKGSTTIEEATIAFEDDFENHAGPLQPQRIVDAQAILAQYGSGTSTGSGTTGSSCGTTSGTIDPNLPQGSKEELISQIKATGNITCGADKLNTQMKQTILAVILRLSQKYKFCVNSTIRSGTGPHSNGSAVDVGNIDGQGVPSGQDYAGYNDTANQFVADGATLLPSGSWMGVSNDKFLQTASAILVPKGASAGLDLPSTTGATGAHFHLNVPASAP